MIFDFTKRTERKIAALEGQAFDLERQLFEANEWVRIGQEKVKEWVEKHDGVLIRLKEFEKKV